MEGATFLTRVMLENYKSIASCDVRLGPLTYLVGANGAGKSNFLDALRFVADSLQNSVGQALRTRGGGDSICHAPHRQQGFFRIHLEFRGQDEGTWHYSLKVGQSEGGGPADAWEVQEERVGLPTLEGRPKPELGFEPTSQWPIFGDRFALEIAAKAPVYRAIYALLTPMLFYNIDPRRIEDVSTFEPGQLLPSDGSNLASVFFRLGLMPGGADERINEYLCLILPGLVRVRAERVLKEGTPLPPDTLKVALLFEQVIRGSVHLFWPSQMSDGTLRMLGILTALLQATTAEGPRPSLVAIEEPEARVHPAALGVLGDALTEASYSTQVLVTTQSADLLDNKEVQTDSILAVSADDGSTRIAPIDAVGRDLIRQRLYTPGELLRIGQILPEAEPANGSADAEQRAGVGGGL